MDCTHVFIDTQTPTEPVKTKRNPWRHWTKERCKASAQQYKTRFEWQLKESSAYQTACRNGWLDECCGHMAEVMKPAGYWTKDKERCKASARRFETRKEWQRGEGSAYNAASKNGWLDECCGHMAEVVKPAGYWTKERCKASARRYKTRNEWQRGEGSAYNTASKNGWLDECCGHMDTGLGCDGDAIYLWRPRGVMAYTCRVYKIGVTSMRLGEQRIRQVAAKYGFSPVIKALAPVNGSAYALERELLQLGRHPYWLSGDGSSEFRALTPAELDQMLGLIAASAA